MDTDLMGYGGGNGGQGKVHEDHATGHSTNGTNNRLQIGS